MRSTTTRTPKLQDRPRLFHTSAVFTLYVVPPMSLISLGVAAALAPEENVAEEAMSRMAVGESTGSTSNIVLFVVMLIIAHVLALVSFSSCGDH